jgi:hypothetical protein
MPMLYNNCRLYWLASLFTLAVFCVSFDLWDTLNAQTPPGFGSIPPGSVTSGLGYSQVDGKEPEVWERASVIYAAVTDVETNRPEQYVIHLQPLATLTGKFDSAMFSEIEVPSDVSKTSGNTMIRDVPKRGMRVIVYVGNDQVHPSRIPAGPVFFMPDHLGLVEVTGFDDPKVTETIENLRKLRGKQREEAEQKAAAEKKGK